MTGGRATNRIKKRKLQTGKRNGWGATKSKKRWDPFHKGIGKSRSPTCNCRKQRGGKNYQQQTFPGTCRRTGVD